MLPKNVHPITTNSIHDNIILLDLTFEYTLWYQPNRNINECQITYYIDGEEYKKQKHETTEG